MSNGPIPPLGPNDLKFTAEPTDFAGLVAGELGPLGTSHDGFDDIFNETATLASGAGAVLDSIDQDLADASFGLSAFDPTETTNLMASLEPAATAADSALAVFNSAVPPDPTGGSGSTPPGGGATPIDTRSYQPSDFPGIQCSSVQGPLYGFAALHVGDAARSNTLNVPLLVSPGRHVQSLTLLDNPEGIFSVAVSPESSSSIATGDRIVITVHPKSAGRKTCVVKVQIVGEPGVNTICVGATIQP